MLAWENKKIDTMNGVVHRLKIEKNVRLGITFS